MLFFLVSFVEDPFAGRRLEGTGEPIRLYRTLAEAEAAAMAPGGSQPDGRVFVVDGDQIEIEEGDGAATHAVPDEAVLNKNPYRPPISVEAGGGYVVRLRDSRLELLLIFRRGCWDLPKGKRDDDEDIEACALREVSEEVGIGRDALRIVADLGTTVHGYTWPKKNAYAVKTTSWYAMTTSEASFTPQVSEDIETVAWASWNEAGNRLGYPNLHEHHAGVDRERLMDLLTSQ